MFHCLPNWACAWTNGNWEEFAQQLVKAEGTFNQNQPNLVFSFLVQVVKHCPDLEYLGYKETARVIKNIHATAIAKGQPVPKLKFTHINNMGSKNRKVSADALRCRKPIMNAIVEVLPQLR